KPIYIRQAGAIVDLQHLQRREFPERIYLLQFTAIVQKERFQLGQPLQRGKILRSHPVRKQDLRAKPADKARMAAEFSSIGDVQVTRAARPRLLAKDRLPVLLNQFEGIVIIPHPSERLRLLLRLRKVVSAPGAVAP